MYLAPGFSRARSSTSPSGTPGPLADAAPSFDAIVPGDLCARRHPAQVLQRQLQALLDQSVDREPPVRKPGLRHALVLDVIDPGRAVRSEVRRDVRCTVLSRQRSRTQQESLDVSCHLFRAFHAVLNPSLAAQSITPGESQRRKRSGGPLDETAPTEPACHAGLHG